jgi:hypothetical protein
MVSNRTLVFKTDTGEERFAIHINDVIIAARCSRATVQRAAEKLGRAPAPGYLWADTAAKWVADRLAPYGSELPTWVVFHCVRVP